MKIIQENLIDFLKEGNDNLALAVLGAPASGKSHTMKNITNAVEDTRIEDTIKGGVNLTVDVLRSELQSKDSLTQVKAFAKAFYYMKLKAKEDPDEFGGWFNDIKNLWENKLKGLMPALNIKVDDKNLLINGKPAIKNLKAFDDLSINTKKAIDALDTYKDYKRVVRYFQGAKQQKAIDKQLNVSYDESGDEPKKIVNSMNKLHKSGYVTDVFLIHPQNVASNLIMNYFRVITGGDGGRDSSDAIVQAYLDIEKNKQIYVNNSEETLKTTSKELQSGEIKPEIQQSIKNANVDDDKERGDKPIDIFTEVSTLSPEEAWKHFSGKLAEINKNLPLILKAILKYKLLSINNLPENAKQFLTKLTSDITNETALKYIKAAEKSGKFVFKYGGITEKFAKDAEKYLT